MPDGLASVAEAVPRCRTCNGEIRSAGLDTCFLHLADGLGVTYRQLDHWVRKGYLRPEREPSRRGSKGSGTFRHWPDEELAVARRMKRLTDAGLAPVDAHRFARELWPDGEIAPGIWISAKEMRDGR